MQPLPPLNEPIKPFTSQAATAPSIPPVKLGPDHHFLSSAVLHGLSIEDCAFYIPHTSAFMPPLHIPC
jgi:hypothetical protein